MNPLLLLQIALSALMRNKMRSFLTMLGVMIGVAAVIAMVGVGTGARQRVQETFSSMGSNLLIVRSTSASSGGVSAGAGTNRTLTWEDLEAIRTELPTVRYAAALTRTNGQVLFEQRNWLTTIHGTAPDYFAIREWATVRGRGMADHDVATGAQTVWLGQTVVEELFDYGVEPIGQIVRINSVPFTVAGVLARRGQSSFGQDNDDVVFMPQSTYRRRVQSGFNRYIDGTLYVSALSFELMDRTQEDVAALLRERHRILPGRPDDFRITNLTEIASAQEEGTRTFTTLLASIAAVSLLVGGIGIMNIMLVSVTERTREIGLRMAVGATPGAIMAQFLVESMLLSLLGGVAGAGLGVFAAQQLGEAYGWTIVLDPGLTTLAIGFSALIGVGFGLYPARRAARLDPIEALRFE